MPQHERCHKCKKCLRFKYTNDGVICVGVATEPAHGFDCVRQCIYRDSTWDIFEWAPDEILAIIEGSLKAFRMSCLATTEQYEKIRELVSYGEKET